MDEKIVVEGIVESIIYYNNGYCVFSIIPHYNKSEDFEEVVCVGNDIKVNKGENLKITGYITYHHSYGEQIKIEHYEKIFPSTVESIEKYLASGAIKGIGEKTASKIVNKFGKDTFNIIENYPKKIALIRGISLKKALEISKIFHEEKESRRILMFLQNYDISASCSNRIYKKFKENTIKVLETNPYILVDEIFGIGFKTADSMANKMGIEKDSYYRIRAGIEFVLNEAALDGDVYLPLEILVERVQQLLNIDDEVIEDAVFILSADKRIWIEKVYGTNVYLNKYYYAENYVAEKLVKLSKAEMVLEFDYDKQIDILEKDNNMKFAKCQRDAIKQSMVKGVIVITGGPGTGKTTTINAIIKLFKLKEYDIELAAPTGRAAKRMTEATGYEAKTLHRLLEATFEDEGEYKRLSFSRNESRPIEADVIIVDESSMIDIVLMKALLRAVAYGTRLILVGDVDQLPAVGPGNVLKDIILSNCINVVRLNEIFRQAQESAIIVNAHRINNGQYPILNQKDKDFFFVKRYNINSILKTIVELITKRLPNYTKCDPIKDIQVLTPMRRSLIGAASLNSVLQTILNPKDDSKPEKEYGNIVFRYGDKVMQIKNDYDMPWKLYKGGVQIDKGTGVFNGDEGFITYINNRGSAYIEVTFDDNKIVRYDYEHLCELQLSYAITIHKSQGSEYKVIIMPAFKGPYMLMNRNLLYTAITRAKNLAVIVGIPEQLYKMVDNISEVNRYTSLNIRIKNYSETNYDL